MRCRAEIRLGPALQQAGALSSELRCTHEELRCTLMSYAVLFWATLQRLHPSEVRSTLLSYAAPFWATLHPTSNFYSCTCTNSSSVRTPFPSSSRASKSSRALRPVMHFLHASLPLFHFCPLIFPTSPSLLGQRTHAGWKNNLKYFFWILSYI